MLAQRMRGDERLELTDQLRSPARRQVGVDSLLEGGEPELVEPRRFGAREGLSCEVGERGPADEGEGLAEERGSLLGKIGRAGLGEQPLEACRVELLRLEAQEVAARMPWVRSVTQNRLPSSTNRRGGE